MESVDGWHFAHNGVGQFEMHVVHTKAPSLAKLFKTLQTSLKMNIRGLVYADGVVFPEVLAGDYYVVAVDINTLK